MKHAFLHYPLICLSGMLMLIMTLFPVYGQVKALPHSHAHNDYEHTHPLLDAMDQGFTSIEADIHLIGNELYVAHDPPASLQGVPTLKEAYLQPLQQHISSNQGFVYQGYTAPVILLVDVKTEAAATYQKLMEQLQDFSSILQTRRNPDGPVKVIISGNRAIDQAMQDPNMTVGIDGRPEDLRRHYDSQWMPLISQDYKKVIQWDGEGKIPEEDFATLKKLAQETHQQGKKLRLWASPDTENVWQTLLQAGVDLINTDHLKELRQFLTENDKKN